MDDLIPYFSPAGESAGLPCVPLQRGALHSEGGRRGIETHLRPLVERLLVDYGGTPGQQDQLREQITHRTAELLEGYDPAAGIPLYPYLARMLDAFAYSYTRIHGTKDAPGAAEAGEESPEAEDRRTCRSLAAAIARLPLAEKRLVIARYYEGQSCEEIAEAQGIPPGAVWPRLRRALNRLRQHYARVQRSRSL